MLPHARIADHDPRTGAQVCDERIRERIVSREVHRMAKSARLARPRGTRPPAAIAAVKSQSELVADTRSLDRIGWAFSIATMIVWAIAAALVRGAAL